MNTDSVRKAAQGIRDILRDAPGGYPDEDAKRRLCSLAQQALTSSDYDGYVSEKVTSMKSFAEVLYSHRKFSGYDTPQQDGATRVRSFIHTDANNLDRWASQAEREKASPESKNT